MLNDIWIMNLKGAFYEEFAKKQEASLDELLSQLRKDLRKELRLPEVEGKIWWLRLEKKK
ncbi:MAG: hypothetical protein ACYC6G_17010 [Desulfobaccales bacterium]